VLDVHPEHREHRSVLFTLYYNKLQNIIETEYDLSKRAIVRRDSLKFVAPLEQVLLYSNETLCIKIGNLEKIEEEYKELAKKAHISIRGRKSAEIARVNGYRFAAYPGTAIGGREHDPLHFHIIKGTDEWRINTETLQELDNKPFPKNLKRLLFKDDAFVEDLRRQAGKIYHTGKLTCP
jgi:hypothetical protein